MRQHVVVTMSSIPRSPRLPARRMHAHRVQLAAVVAMVAVVGAACDPPSAGRTGRSGASSGCVTQVAEASAAVEVAEQVALLDEALVVCRSYAALTGELARYPGIIGFDERTFVKRRCTAADEETVQRAPVCSAVIEPTTTLPASTLPELLFVGETIDGRQVELRPSDGVTFVEGVPAAIQQTVDIAFEDDCEGVVIQRDFWLAQIDAGGGDEASIYAKHAENVMEFIGCNR